MVQPDESSCLGMRTILLAPRGGLATGGRRERDTRLWNCKINCSRVRPPARLLASFAAGVCASPRGSISRALRRSGFVESPESFEAAVGRRQGVQECLIKPSPAWALRASWPKL